MRVLVTRPAADAAHTAARLEARGHEAVISPVLAIRAALVAAPPGPFDALLLTSAHSLLAFPAGIPSDLASAPVLCVGERTAAAARAAGFLAVTAAPGGGAALANLVRQMVRPGARLLYLAGAERKPCLEQALADFAPLVVEVYRAEPAARLTAAAELGLREGTIDAVLHYSRRSAQIYLAICEAGALLAKALKPRQLCLSEDIAAALPAAARGRAAIASAPEESALLALLG